MLEPKRKKKKGKKKRKKRKRELDLESRKSTSFCQPNRSISISRDECTTLNKCLIYTVDTYISLLLFFLDWDLLLILFHQDKIFEKKKQQVGLDLKLIAIHKARQLMAKHKEKNGLMKRAVGFYKASKKYSAWHCYFMQDFAGFQPKFARQSLH